SEELKDLEFKNVTFAYPAGSLMPALRDISFKVSKGETLAVIGPTGSGKSTLAWLCLRFYDADKGTISLNGKDIRLLDCSRLRADIALAPQKSMLFTGTVADNISWGRRSASEKEIMEAAKMAQADEFVKNMPAKYNSVLGQGGVNLSGGQKQRISIARAIAKKSDIMIFDDCTSALDAVTEAKVRQELKKLKDKKIIIMITQRVGTAMFADKILVLDNGQNVGLGSHKELLNSCETYRGIFDSQIGSDLKR
ncbi:MAG: ABC transporter ATP-binding protein, partial [Clostridiaceae bacterium]